MMDEQTKNTMPLLTLSGGEDIINVSCKMLSSSLTDHLQYTTDCLKCTIHCCYCYRQEQQKRPTLDDSAVFRTTEYVLHVRRNDDASDRQVMTTTDSNIFSWRLNVLPCAQPKHTKTILQLFPSITSSNQWSQKTTGKSLEMLQLRLTCPNSSITVKHLYFNSNNSLHFQPVCQIWVMW